MKLHLQTGTALVVTGSGPGWIRVNGDEYRQNLVLTPSVVVPGVVPGGFDALTAADFEALLEHKPELALLGTGARQRFPHPRLTATLGHAHVGLEVMDTPAACRTYNVLAGEDRRVVALLLLDPAPA